MENKKSSGGGNSSGRGASSSHGGSSALSHLDLLNLNPNDLLLMNFLENQQMYQQQQQQSQRSSGSGGRGSANNAAAAEQEQQRNLAELFAQNILLAQAQAQAQAQAAAVAALHSSSSSPSPNNSGNSGPNNPLALLQQLSNNAETGRGGGRDGSAVSSSQLQQQQQQWLYLEYLARLQQNLNPGASNAASAAAAQQQMLLNPHLLLMNNLFGPHGPTSSGASSTTTSSAAAAANSLLAENLANFNNPFYNLQQERDSHSGGGGGGGGGGKKDSSKKSSSSSLADRYGMKGSSTAPTTATSTIMTPTTGKSIASLSGSGGGGGGSNNSSFLFESPMLPGSLDLLHGSGGGGNRKGQQVKNRRKSNSKSPSPSSSILNLQLNSNLKGKGGNSGGGGSSSSKNLSSAHNNLLLNQFNQSLLSGGSSGNNSLLLPQTSTNNSKKRRSRSNSSSSDTNNPLMSHQGGGGGSNNKKAKKSGGADNKNPNSLLLNSNQNLFNLFANNPGNDFSNLAAYSSSSGGGGGGGGGSSSRLKLPPDTDLIRMVSSSNNLSLSSSSGGGGGKNQGGGGGSLNLKKKSSLDNKSSTSNSNITITSLGNNSNLHNLTNKQQQQQQPLSLSITPTNQNNPNLVQSSIINSSSGSSNTKNDSADVVSGESGLVKAHSKPCSLILPRLPADYKAKPAHENKVESNLNLGVINRLPIGLSFYTPNNSKRDRGMSAPNSMNGHNKSGPSSNSSNCSNSAAAAAANLGGIGGGGPGGGKKKTVASLLAQSRNSSLSNNNNLIIEPISSKSEIGKSKNEKNLSNNNIQILPILNDTSNKKIPHRPWMDFDFGSSPGNSSGDSLNIFNLSSKVSSSNLQMKRENNNSPLNLNTGSGGGGGGSSSNFQLNIPNVQPPDLNLPLKSYGWKRETVLKGLMGINGNLSGEVLYVAPNGVRCKTINEVKKQLSVGQNALGSGPGLAPLTSKLFSFSSRLLIGDFILPNSNSDKSGGGGGGSNDESEVDSTSETNKEIRLTANQLAKWLEMGSSSEGQLGSAAEDFPFLMQGTSGEGKQLARTMTKEEEEKLRKEMKEKEELKEMKRQHSLLIRAMELHRRAKRRHQLQQERKKKKQEENLAASLAAIQQDSAVNNKNISDSSSAAVNNENIDIENKLNKEQVESQTDIYELNFISSDEELEEKFERDDVDLLDFDLEEESEDEDDVDDEEESSSEDSSGNDGDSSSTDEEDEAEKAVEEEQQQQTTGKMKKGGKKRNKKGGGGKKGGSSKNKKLTKKLEKKKKLLKLKKSLSKQKNVLSENINNIDSVNTLTEPSSSTNNNGVSKYRIEDLDVLNKVPGLRLNAKTFANMLQIYEFLHTFGETLGFDVDSLPTLSNLQKALLNSDEAHEEELLSVVSHLLVCAVEDPGMGNPQRHQTAFGQTLKQADISFGSLSEVLRLYLLGITDSEPEAEELATWLNEATFLAQSPQRKSQILTFLCDLLLQNKAVLKFLETSTEQAHSAKKERIANEVRIRRLRMLCARKVVASMTENQEESSSTTDLMSYVNTSDLLLEETINQVASKASLEDKNASGLTTPLTKKPAAEGTPTAAGQEENNAIIISTSIISQMETDTVDENDDKNSTISSSSATAKEKKSSNKKDIKIAIEDTTTMSNSSTPVKGKGDEIIEKVKDTSLDTSNPENIMSVDEIRSKMNQLQNLNEKLRKQINNNLKIIRSNSLGQDRWRRRYWNLPFSGGIYIEGGSTCEEIEVQEKVQKRLENLKWRKKKLKYLKKINKIIINKKKRRNAAAAAALASKNEKEKQEEEDKVEKMEVDICIDKVAEIIDDKKPPVVEEDILVNIKKETEEVVGGEIKQEEKENDENKIPLLPPPPPLPPSSIIKNELLDTNNNDNNITIEEPCIKIFSFSNKLNCFGKMKEKPEPTQLTDDELMLKKVKKEHWDGWWRLDTVEEIEEFIKKLCNNGMREGPLKNTLSSTYPGYAEDFSDDEISNGPNYHQNSTSYKKGWDPDLSYKVHLQLLETMETLEERVASASLQVKGWQLPSKLTNASESDIIENVKVRLLDLETAIERRYLKPPLGKSLNELNLSTLGQSSSNSSGSQSSQNNSSSDRDTSNQQGNGQGNSKDDQNSKDDNNSNNGNEQSTKQNYQESKALLHWRDAIIKSSTPGVLSMAVCQLDSSIAWDKSVMKACCQLCKGGDNEDKLLLCDACDRGYHTYCFKPPLEQIPDGDWFCWECINKATGVKGCIVCGKNNSSASGPMKILSCDKCVKAFHFQCITPPLAKVPRGRWLCHDHRKLSSPNRNSLTLGGNSSTSSNSSSSKKSKPKAKSASTSVSALAVSTPSSALNQSTTIANVSAASFVTSTPTPTISDTSDTNTDYEGNSSQSNAVGSISTSSSKKSGKGNNSSSSLTLLENSSNISSITTTTITTTAETNSDGDSNSINNKLNLSNASNSLNENESDSKSSLSALGGPTASSSSSSSSKNENNASPVNIKLNKKQKSETVWCEKILDELMNHDDAWPFIEPVNTRQFPTYKKVIKTPMDLKTIKNKLKSNVYACIKGTSIRESFLSDVKLIFDNCETFNEDDSPVGKAGHSLRLYFESNKTHQLFNQNQNSNNNSTNNNITTSNKK